MSAEGDALGDAIRLGLDAVAVVDPQDRIELFRAMGNAIISALGSSAPVPVTTATFSATLTHAGKILHVTRTATGACAITVASSAVADNTFGFAIKDAGLNADANSITVTCAGGELIDGEASLVINSDGDAINFYSNGTALFLK